MPIEPTVITHTVPASERKPFFIGPTPLGIFGGIVVVVSMLLLALWFCGAFNRGIGKTVDTPVVAASSTKP